MKTAKRVAKNTGILFLGDNITKILSLILAVLIARFLAVEEFGIFSFALGFTALFTVLTDLGIDAYIRREVSRQKDQVNKYVSNALVAKSIMSIFTLIIIFLSIKLLGYDAEASRIVYLSAFAIVFESLSQTIASTFISLEIVKYNTLIKILRVISRFSLTIVVLLAGLGAYEVMAVYLAAQVFGFVISIAYYNRKVTVLKPLVDLAFARSLVKKGLPFGIATIFIMIYFKIDITMLSKMVGDSAVAWYSAAYNLLEALYFLPIALTSALLPITSRYFIKAKKKLEHTCNLASKALFIITIPVAIGTTMIADKIILLLYGTRYAESIVALQILIWTIIPSFFTYILGLMLISSDNEKIGMYTTASAAALNIVLNIMLIPKYSYVGASMATVITETVLMVLNYYFVSKKLFLPAFVRIIYKPAIASTAMALIILSIRQTSLFLIIPVAAVTYGITIYLIKGIDTQEKRMIFSLFK